jgi:outer membrane receptor protein involved in Fe transport
MFFTQSLDVTVPFASFADLFFPESAPHTSAVLVADQGFDKFTQELRLTSASNQRFEWIVGAFYNDEDGHNIQDLVITPPAPLFYANFPSNYKETSLYATGTWYFTPDLDASVGIRYADYSNDVELVAEGPLVAPLPLSEIDDDVTTYLFNLRYRAGDHTSFYGRIASGYRPGGANFLLIDPGTGEPLTSPFFEPDELWSYEFGVKGSTADGLFTYDVAAYYIDWEDYIINVTRGGVNVAGNAEKATSRGIEASLGMALTDALTITGIVSYTNAELGADDPDLGGSDGDRLPNSPDWQVALDIDYRFNLGNLPSYVGAAWRHKGEMPVGFKGYTDASGTYYPPSAPYVDLDSYNLVDLRAGTRVGAFDVSLYVTNVFDEWAYTSFGSSFVSPSLGTPTRPRTYGAMVRWNFF